MEEGQIEDVKKRRRNDDSSDEEKPVDEPQRGLKKTPKDLEDLLKKKKVEDEKSSKPKFLTREEREARALERRAKEIEEKYKNRGLGEQRKQSTDYLDAREAKKAQKQDKRSMGEMSDKELEMIKNEHLGKKIDTKKYIKPSEKMRFRFDWDATEDTMLQLQPLWSGEVKPLFGRGYVGGVDRKEQLNQLKKQLQDQAKEMEGRNDEFSQTMKQEVEKKLEKLAKFEVPSDHWTEKALEKMTARDWRIFKEDFNIATKGGSIPPPIRYWHESALSDTILHTVEKIGYEHPSPIQRQAIPIALIGRDVIGIAETGSGKTAAYLIPLMEFVMKMPRLTAETEQDGPYAVILAPTRELASQIDQEAEKFARPCGIRTVLLVGGVAIEEQALQLRKGCEVIIATPGRLNDCLSSRHLVLNQCTYVVLDEADRMIDLGFEADVNQILDAMPVSNLKSENEEEASKQEGSLGKYRTTIMYSATMPPEVERLARKYLRRPAYVIIGEIGRAVDRISQHVEWVSEEGKMKKLVELLTDGPPPPIIVFCNKKKLCDTIVKSLEKMGWKPVTLHSGKNQSQRDSAIQGFKAKKYDILVATDVASRGIDVRGVTHVINFDMPKTIDDYTHRIGRTGRAGTEGVATSLLTNDNTDIMFDLKQMLMKTNNFVPIELEKHPSAQVKPGTVPDRVARKDTIIYAK